jgi:hypothetical protein
LEESAVDQDLKTVFAAGIAGGVDQVLGAGDGAGRAQELDVHALLREGAIVTAGSILET